jgi:hypothetical protein
MSEPAAQNPEPDGPGRDPRAGRLIPAGTLHERLPRQRRHYPWEALRALYVQGREGETPGSIEFPSCQVIAREYGLQATRIRAKAAEQGWVKDRTEYQANLERLRAERKGTHMLREIIAADDRALTTATLGASLVFNRVTEIAHEATARAAAKAEWERLRDIARAAVGPSTTFDDDDAESPEDRRAAITEQMAEIDYDPWAPPVIDAKELSTLAQAAANWHTLALKSLGESEIRKIEVSGPGGAPVQVQAATIYQELTRDDPARLHSLMAAFGRAVLGSVADEPLQLVAGDADDGADPGDGSGDAA